MLTRLMLILLTPALRSDEAADCRSMPFVVMLRSSIPGMLLNVAMKSATPFLARGSPPVILIFDIPLSAAILTILNISSYLSISS